METIKRLISSLIIALFLATAVYSAARADQLDIIPDALSKTGKAGSVTTYTINVVNTDPTNPVTLSLIPVSTRGWSVVCAPSTLNLAAGVSGTFQVNISIPPKAEANTSDITLISFSDGVSEVASISLTTEVGAPSTIVIDPFTLQMQADLPLITMPSYSVDVDKIVASTEFGIEATFKNSGTVAANSVMVTFSSDSFYPLENGGVVVISSLEPGKSKRIGQRFITTGTIPWGVTSAPISAAVSYVDDVGTSYSSSFTITIAFAGAHASLVIEPTRTPTPMSRAQLVVSNYRASVDPLQPGTKFDLEIGVQNLGSASARGITMILGGGGTQQNSEGTPSPSGLSGGGSDLNNFAPLGSSNLVYLNDMAAGTEKALKMNLIVNTTTNPGAYPLKISFVYNDDRNQRFTDDQVITLLVYSLPQVEVNFYRDPGQLFAGQDNVLPLQVTNLGRKAAVLGNMTVSCKKGTVTNNTGLVGSLEPGGYFTIDTMLMPEEEGAIDLDIVVNYTDDFGQARTIKQTLELTIEPAMEMPTPDPNMTMGPDGMPVLPQTEETFGDKVLRFVKGFLGLDSSPAQPQVPGMEMPGGAPEEMPGGKPVKPLG